VAGFVAKSLARCPCLNAQQHLIRQFEGTFIRNIVIWIECSADKKAAVALTPNLDSAQ
jgi:hypothetical protein